MDGLIMLLIVIGVIARISKSNKKKAAEAARRQEQAEKIPYSREEWDAYLKAEGIPARPKANAKPAAAVPTAPAKPVKAQAKPAAQPVKAAAAPIPATPSAPGTGSIRMDPNQGVEGETVAEHSMHRQRAAQAEAQAQIEQEALQALRAANLQALRNAVVMKEILDKPVALRPRRFG